MKKIRIKVCEDCPHYYTEGMERLMTCGHKDAPDWRQYENLVDRSSAPPEWCPIRKAGNSVVETRVRKLVIV